MSKNSQNVLINRMSTNDVNKLIEFTHKNPIKGQNCIDELCERISWLDVKYDTICTLHDVFGCDFNPIDISNLFPNKK